MKRTALFAACVLMCGAAGAQSIGESTGINSALGITPKTTDFVLEVAQSDMFEIESSKLAVQKGSDAVRTFANQMIADHTKTTAELKDAARAANVPVPTALDDTHKRLLDKLQNLDAAAFNRQYMDDQVTAHKDAVSLFQRYGKGGDNEKLKTWAVTTLPALQHHLDMAQMLDK